MKLEREIAELSVSMCKSADYAQGWNDCLKAVLAKQAEDARDGVFIPLDSARKAIRAMQLCERECKGWDKYAEPIKVAISAMQESTHVA